MTPEEQRIAIAEACGWKKDQHPQAIGFWHDPKADPLEFTVELPDYLNDLNAMHESLRSQSREFNAFFADALNKRAAIVGVYVHQLTAKDWADAFLRVYA